MTRLQRRLALAVGASLLVAAAYVAIRHYHVHDAIAQRWDGRQPGDAWNRPSARAAARWLPGYAFDIEDRPIADVRDNLSGLDFDPASGHLLAVVNRPPELLVLDTDGRLLRRHPIEGASDVEALVALGAGDVLLLQEGKRLLVRARLPRRAGEPVRADKTMRVRLDARGPRNSGPEGMAYDAATDTLYVAKESDPVALYAITGIRDGRGRTTQVDRSAWLRPLRFASDLSGLAFDPATGHLFLLSDQSQLVAEIDGHGAPVSWISLRDKARRLPPPQPEGLAIDAHGTLYIASEPNLFYRMRARATPVR